MALNLHRRSTFSIKSLWGVEREIAVWGEEMGVTSVERVCFFIPSDADESEIGGDGGSNL